MKEIFFNCPHCWQDISMLVDASVEAQTYIEDCEVCCNPIELTVQFREGKLQGFEAQKIGQ